MRPLTEDESKAVFKKLDKYIGGNTRFLVDRKDEEWVFRLHKKKVWYVKVAVEKLAGNFSKDNLVGAGVCFGRFTHAGKFRLVVTCLDFLAQYAQFKFWVKPNQEQAFMYGNNITRAGLGRITEGTPRHQGVVIFNMADVPLGFGVTARSTLECRKLESGQCVVFHEADVGEYVRREEQLL
ncbi:60S ribosome subunit biogenesis protein NIP7-like protein [Diplonema papillatum]|nr:60S ribosome subunit biogenesis protein NIP7-like protein [Diplonema papillatum]